MGAPRLLHVDQGGSLCVRGACAALRVELEAGDWASEAEVAAAFPQAEWSNGRLVVFIDGPVCVEVAFNYERRIALITAAGLRPAPSDVIASERRGARA